jgi:ATP-dependent RNA helicase DDX23/PRP28
VKKLRRFTDKKFNFEWDESEDTSSLVPPLATSKTTVKNDLQGSHRRGFDDRHWSEKGLHEMTDRDWRIFKEDFNINTSGGVMPHPVRHWHESGLPGDLLSTIKRLNYTQPTPIQRQAIPLALEGRDFIGVAETGSGKTASFILPMIMEIMKLPKMNAETAADGPYGLVLVPTRELANQIEGEARKFLTPLGFNCFAVVGGHAVAEQAFSLRNGAEIIIATPGRLRDCLDQHVIVLNQLKYAVLDEADRMIDMNFEEDIRYILDCVPRARNITAKYPMHMTMFSATMPITVERLARTYLQKPATIFIGQAGRVADTIEQHVEMIREEGKSQRVIEILQGRALPPIIIFVNQKRTVDYLCKRLDSFGFKTVSLHGGKSQDQREAAINQLKTGQRDILVATDVAGRGIDIKNVSLVINYDMSRSIEGKQQRVGHVYIDSSFYVDYTHRVGRTGRAGAKGTAISFLTPDDVEIYSDLRVLLSKSANSHMPPEFLQHEASRQQRK